jgi:hypothetical protein
MDILLPTQSTAIKRRHSLKMFNFYLTWKFNQHSPAEAFLKGTGTRDYNFSVAVSGFEIRQIFF